MLSLIHIYTPTLRPTLTSSNCKANSRIPRIRSRTCARATTIRSDVYKRQAFDGATIDYALDRYAFAGWTGAEVPRVDGSDIKVADETWSIGGDVLTTAFPLVEFYAAYKTDIVIRNVAAGDTEFFDYTRTFGLWSVSYTHLNNHGKAVREQ